MTDPKRDPWPSVEDRPAQAGCKFCEARDREPHGLDCPLFLPICACGAVARRYEANGLPVCAQCRVKARADIVRSAFVAVPLSAAERGEDPDHGF
jgi:hypothetical protein